jgi:hypothetical protein
MFEECKEEIRRVQRETRRPIDAIIDDTLGRSIGVLPENAAETGHIFTREMEGLIQEFQCPVIVNAHEPKSGGTISGTQRFLNNAPVTPKIEGEKDAGKQLVGFTVTMDPKYRIGPTPKPFSVKAITVSIPEPVNGASSDLVFVVKEDLFANLEKDSKAYQEGKDEKFLLFLLGVVRAEGPQKHKDLQREFLVVCSKMGEKGNATLFDRILRKAKDRYLSKPLGSDTWDFSPAGGQWFEERVKEMIKTRKWFAGFPVWVGGFSFSSDGFGFDGFPHGGEKPSETETGLKLVSETSETDETISTKPGANVAAATVDLEAFRLHPATKDGTK